MNKLFIALFFVGLLFASSVSASMNCTIANATEVGKNFPVTCATGYSFATVCMLNTYDENSNFVQGWYVNPDDQGYIMKYVNFDSRYAVGHNYTLTVQCAGVNASGLVFVDVGGNVASNIEATNFIAYIMAHPEESIAFGIIVLLVVLGAVALFKFVRK